MRKIAALMLIGLLAAGCARPKPAQTPPMQQPQVQGEAPAPPSATTPAQPDQQAAPAAPKKPATAAELRQQATDLAAKGDYGAAASRWAQLVQLEPTAENYNELSFANLQASRYKEAAEAGEKAVRLKPDHPYALFNAGLALLELGQFCGAVNYLKRSAHLQPDRYEPQLALARAHHGLFSYSLASFHAERAVHLSQGAAEARAVQRAVESMRSAKVPANLATASVSRQQAGGITFYLYREATGCGGIDAHTLYAVRPSGSVLSLPLGPVPAGKSLRLVSTPLPGGATGFWLEGDVVGAGIAGTSKWLLIVYGPERLDQVLFVGNRESFMEGVSDYLRAAAAPAVEGDRIVTGYRADVNGAYDIVTTRRLAPDLRTAATVDQVWIMDGQLEAVGQTIGIRARYGYSDSFPLAPGAQLTTPEGRPFPRSDLRAGLPVEATIRDGQIVSMKVMGSQ